MRRRLDPALVAYTSDPRGRAALSGMLDSWRSTCADVGAADGDGERAVAVSVLLTFLSGGDESADAMRDRAATLVLALMDQDGGPGD